MTTDGLYFTCLLKRPRNGRIKFQLEPHLFDSGNVIFEISEPFIDKYGFLICWRSAVLLFIVDQCRRIEIHIESKPTIFIFTSNEPQTQL